MKIIIDEKEFSEVGKQAKGVLYYGDYMIEKRLFWDVLVDYGNTGLWLKIAGTNSDKMIKNFSNILSNYKLDTLANRTHGSFYLKHGVIQLPYLEQESSYARFEGHPLDLRLEIEMSETHSVEESGPVERLAAALSSNFAPGVNVKKIRAGKKVVAGLLGEEIIVRMDDGDEPELHFGWEYTGKEDSGDHPMIQIEMESPDGKIDEKLKGWDAILNSMTWRD